MSYLFILLAICWIPPSLSLRKDIIQSLNSNEVQLLNQLPDIRIKDGLVSIDQKDPYFIKQNGKTVAIIDTTGSMNYIDDSNVMALLTESELIVRRGKNQFNTLSLSKVADFHINKHIVNGWIHTTKNSLAPLSYGIFLLLSYIFTVLLMLLAAVVGLILSFVIHSSIKFAGILRIAAAAATPAIILIALSIALGQRVPGLVYIVITMIYLLVGIISCSKPAEEEDIPQVILSDLLQKNADKKHRHAA